MTQTTTTKITGHEAIEGAREGLTAKAAGEGEPTPHFPNEHGDCPSWCVGCQSTPPQRCFFPDCQCVSTSLGDCRGEHSAPEVEQVKRERDLITSQLLMVGSEICGDPKLDPKDHRDPRWTPTLEEAAKLRADNERLRGALERLYKQAATHWASMSIATELDAARAVLAGEQLPDADAKARSDWHHGYPASALLRLVAYALRECGYARCRALADDIERFADLHPSYDSAVELSGALLVMLRQLGGLTARADYLLSGLAAKQSDWIEPLKRRKHWLTPALAGATTITGHEAIETAERLGLSLSKHADPIEGAREGLTVDEAREIAAENPGLVYIEAELGELIADEQIERLEQEAGKAMLD